MSFQGVPPQRQAAFVLLEAFLLDHAAHVSRQASKPVQVVGFGDFANSLLLVTVAGVAQPEQAGMLDALLFGQRI